MESIDKIKKDIEKRNKNNKNYFWILSILIFTVMIIFYSYETNKGIIAEQMISSELVAKNQETINQHIPEHKIKKEKTPPKQELSNEELLKDAIVKDIIEKNIKGNVKKNGNSSLEGPVDENILINDEEQLLLAEKEILEEDSDEAPENEEASVEEKQIIIQPTPIVIEPKETTPLKVATVIPVEKIIEKPAEIEQEQKNDASKVLEPKSHFNLYKCYSLEAAKLSFVQHCEESLNEFLSANTNASKLEIIGIIDLEDAKSLSNKSDASQEQLAKARIDTVRNYLKNKTKFSLSDHQYYLKSELPTRGFVIRAYF